MLRYFVPVGVLLGYPVRLVVFEFLYPGVDPEVCLGFCSARGGCFGVRAAPERPWQADRRVHGRKVRLRSL